MNDTIIWWAAGIAGLVLCGGFLLAFLRRPRTQARPLRRAKTQVSETYAGAGNAVETALSNLSHPTEAMNQAVKGEKPAKKQEAKPAPKNAMSPPRPGM